ncbi:MAG: AMIN domain-containing protein [Gammaproteobacteria bacterium]
MRRALLPVCFWLIVTTASADAATLLHMGSKPVSGALEFKLSFDRTTTHSHFTVDGPDRLVIDFADTRKVRGIRDQRLNHTLVRGIRYGVRPNNALRVVIDLTEPVRFLLDRPESTPGIVRITLAPRDAEAFVAAQPPTATDTAEDANPAPRVSAASPFRSPIRMDDSITSHHPQPPENSPAALADAGRPARPTPASDDACQDAFPFEAACVVESATRDYDPVRHSLAEEQEKEPEYEGTFGLIDFPAFAGYRGRRIDVGYRGKLDGNEIGVSLLRPAITWKSETDDGDIHMRLGSGELSLGIRRVW